MDDPNSSGLRAGSCAEADAKAEATRIAAALLRRELSQAICIRQMINPVIAGTVTLPADAGFVEPLLEQFFDNSHDPYGPAKRLIDQHGRWARHVALENAIGFMIAGDEAKEEEWRSVFVAVLELQVPHA